MINKIHPVRFSFINLIGICRTSRINISSDWGSMRLLNLINI